MEYVRDIYAFTSLVLLKKCQPINSEQDKYLFNKLKTFNVAELPTCCAIILNNLYVVKLW